MKIETNTWIQNLIKVSSNTKLQRRLRTQFCFKNGLQAVVQLSVSISNKAGILPFLLFVYIVADKIEFPQEEEHVLEYWHKIDAFHEQLRLSKAREGAKPYTFYDGPPFATGLPHYGHIAAGTIKDVMTRYATQTGHYCSRRFGWDCHGLPIEYEIDKRDKITSSAEREAVSITTTIFLTLN